MAEPHQGPIMEQPAPERVSLHPMESTYAGTVHEELQPKRRKHLGFYPVREIPCWSGEGAGGERSSIAEVL